MQTMQNVLVATALMMAAAFPAAAQQDSPPAPGEERSAPQGGPDDEADRQAPGGGTIPVVEPATGIEIGRVGEASLGDLERSVALAREAQITWAAVSFTERAAVMRRAAGTAAG